MRECECGLVYVSTVSASDALELKLPAVVSLLIWEWVTKISSNFPVYLPWILCLNESLFPPQLYRAPDDCLIYL